MITAALVIAIVIIIILIIILYLNPIQSKASVPELQAETQKSISLQQGFKTNFAVSCQNLEPGDLCRGTCLLYESFSTNPEVVDNLTPIGAVNDPNLPDSLTCLDGFNNPLIKFQSTCEADQCVGRDGRTYQRGEIEYFYQSCGDYQTCGGKNDSQYTTSPRSAIILDYQTIGAQINRTQSRCLVAEIQNQDASKLFSAQVCPNNNQITEQFFLSLETNPQGLTSIRAPGTGVCLTGVKFESLNQQSEGLPLRNSSGILNQRDDSLAQLQAIACENTSFSGYDWFVSPAQVITPGFIQPQTRIYPKQYVLANSPNALEEFSELADPLVKNIESQFKAYRDTFRRLTDSQQQIVINFISDNDIDAKLASADVKELKKIADGINPAKNLRIFTYIRNGIYALIKFYQTFGPARSAYQSLQLNSNKDLTIGYFGSCPISPFDPGQTCRFTTETISVYQWRCT